MAQPNKENFKPDIDLNGDYKPTFHDFYYLMKFKVTKILLLSSLYDAFILEEEGLLTKQISGEYQDLELSSPPQVVRVSSGEDALKELNTGRYDLIITMSQLVDLDPFEFCKQAKEIQKDIPVVMLATDPSEVTVFHKPGEMRGIDKVFYWNGDSSLLMAITKYIEDQVNIGFDIKHGFVKTLLIIEDSPVYYSMFLPIIYSEIMRQNHALIAEGLNEHEKWFRKKARPKILLAETYEEGLELYHKYRDDILGIITDVTFPKEGVYEKDAGFQFLEEVDKDIPVLIQSSHPEHSAKAEELNLPFLDKNSENLPQDLQDYLKNYLGFGAFVFMMPDGRVIGHASGIKEFLDIVEDIPVESIKYHASNNHFSTWLMARGRLHLQWSLDRKKSMISRTTRISNSIS
jgi:CheY-like chemotaxis protein